MIGSIAALLLQATVPATFAPRDTADSLPSVTLAEAMQRALGVSPDYVLAAGQLDQAEWGRRAALLSFIVPSLSVSVDASKFSEPFFNLGIGRPTDEAVNFRANASYEVFSLRKLTDLTLTAAELESARQNELQRRFLLAFDTERDFLDVLASRELLRVARSRYQRAVEQLEVARARVLSGAAVQTDSLQLVVELTEAELGVLRQEALLSVARLQLGRRIGEAGPVDARAVDTTLPPPLDASNAMLALEAAEQGPQYRAARADERSADAFLRGQRGRYLPALVLTGGYTRYDDSFFPSARTVSSMTLTISLPIWDLGNREVAITQARVNRDVARAVRADLERAALRDVTAAAELYRTARTAVGLSQRRLDAARETFRVQDLRYRGGANTILDVLEAQFQLTSAEAAVVQAQYALRLARAGLEVILGRRLFNE